MADECKQIIERRTCRLCLGYVADAHILAGSGVQYRQLSANMLETRADKRLRVQQKVVQKHASANKLRNRRDRQGSSLSTSSPIILVDVSQITKNVCYRDRIPIVGMRYYVSACACVCVYRHDFSKIPANNKLTKKCFVHVSTMLRHVWFYLNVETFKGNDYLDYQESSP